MRLSQLNSDTLDLTKGTPYVSSSIPVLIPISQLGITAPHHAHGFAGLTVSYMGLEFEPILWLLEGGHGWMCTQDTDDKLHSPVCNCLYQHMLSLVLQYLSNVLLNFHP